MSTSLYSSRSASTHGTQRHTVFGGGDTRGLRRMLVVSALLHAVAIAGVFVWRSTPVDRPPPYRVTLIGAPPGKRQMGVVAPPTNAPPAPSPTPTPAPAAAEKVVPKDKAIAKKKTPPPPKATPNTAKNRDAAKQTAPKTSASAPPVAGSGAKGDKGADITTMIQDGIDFPYPGYLRNVVRLIKLNFPEQPPGSTLRAEVRFMIHRDGTVTDIEVLKGSGNSTFNLNAMGAVEAGGARGAFGRLPDGFPDDVLVVYFLFSPETS